MLFDVMSSCEATCSDLVQKQKFIAFFDSEAHVSNAAQHLLLIELGHLKFG